MGKTIRAFKTDKDLVDYSPKNKVSSIYQKHGIEEQEEIHSGHRPKNSGAISKKLRKILKREAECLIDSEIG